MLLEEFRGEEQTNFPQATFPNFRAGLNGEVGFRDVHKNMGGYKDGIQHRRITLDVVVGKQQSGHGFVRVLAIEEEAEWEVEEASTKATRSEQ